MVSVRKKSQTGSKPRRNAGRANKQPPTKSTASSSRQLVGATKGGSSKIAQKIAQKPNRRSTRNPEVPAEQSKKTGNKRKAEETIEKDNGGLEIVKMPMLKPKVRNIPQGIVETKWGPLPEKAQEEVLDVVRAAERPVLMTFRNENKKAEAQEILRGAARKLQAALPRIPVPPMGRDMTLNYEKLIDKNRELESVLEPNLRQIAELEAEIEQEQKRLEQDEAYYRNLKNNALSQEKIRREKTRSMHPLLRSVADTDGGIKDGINDINLSSAKFPAVASSYDASSDRQVLPLTRALQQHLSSMQGNSGPLEEVAEWILRSKAAVDEVLFQRAGEKVYDRIIGL